jgi:sugar/nucleoside kinase (ribokinase family)
MRIPFRILPPAAGRPFDVVGLGENSIDLVAVVADYPTSNTKQRLQRFARHPGGQVATAMAACARLGWRARYIGRFGADEFGAQGRESLVRDGVDTDFALTAPGTTNQFAIILVDARTGERTVLWDRHPGLTIEPAEVPADAVLSGRILMLDCVDTAASAQAARLARQAGMPTLLDVEKIRPGINDLLQHIDAIIAAQDFPTALTGHDDPGRALEALAREFDAPFVCVTLGAEGSLARCGGREIRTRAFPIDCVDTTGAGDVFRAAFAAGCLRAPDGDIEDVLVYANAAAALNCRALGARGALPTAEDVEQLLLAKPHI